MRIEQLKQIEIAPFRITGVGMILFALVILAAIELNRETAARGGRDLKMLWPAAAALGLLGVGLVQHHRWSAIAAGLLLVGVGIYFIAGAMETPLPGAILNLVFAVLVLIVPFNFYRSRALLPGGTAGRR